jgi:hypothetical protein
MRWKLGGLRSRPFDTERYLLAEPCATWLMRLNEGIAAAHDDRAKLAGRLTHRKLEGRFRGAKPAAER